MGYSGEEVEVGELRVFFLLALGFRIRLCFVFLFFSFVYLRTFDFLYD